MPSLLPSPPNRKRLWQPFICIAHPSAKLVATVAVSPPWRQLWEMALDKGGGGKRNSCHAISVQRTKSPLHCVKHVTTLSLLSVTNCWLLILFELSSDFFNTQGNILYYDVISGWLTTSLIRDSYKDGKLCSQEWVHHCSNGELFFVVLLWSCRN